MKLGKIKLALYFFVLSSFLGLKAEDKILSAPIINLEKLEPSYEILENETEVKVMGQGIFEDYSKAIDNTLKISKGFMIGAVLFFITSLFL